MKFYDAIYRKISRKNYGITIIISKIHSDFLTSKETWCGIGHSSISYVLIYVIC
jgi:hypothetical protein